MTQESFFLVVAVALFCIGAMGFIIRRNLILIILSAELMLHGVGISLVTFSRLHGNLDGQILTIFVLAVAACEAGLGLALILGLYQRVKTLDITLWSGLREDDLPSAITSNCDLTINDSFTADFPTLAPAGAKPELAK